MNGVMETYKVTMKVTLSDLIFPWIRGAFLAGWSKVMVAFGFRVRKGATFIKARLSQWPRVQLFTCLLSLSGPLYLMVSSVFLFTYLDRLPRQLWGIINFHIILFNNDIRLRWRVLLGMVVRRLLVAHSGIFSTCICAQSMTHSSFASLLLRTLVSWK